MKLIHKLLRGVLAAAMLLQLSALPAFAANTLDEKPVYLALGDSITSGHGLSADEKDFTELVGEALPGYEVYNEGVSGATSADVYALVKGGTLNDKIADADLITITWGGNDMMNTLYAEVAKVFNGNSILKIVYKAPTIVAEDVPYYLLGSKEFPKNHDVLQVTLLGITSNVITGYTKDKKEIPAFCYTDAFNSALTAFKSNIEKTIDLILEKNPDVHIVVNTQYDPYKAFKNVYTGEPEIDKQYQVMYPQILACLEKLNGVITKNNSVSKYTLADVYAAFEPYNGSLCNAKANGANPDLDFHPNAEGHAVIADVVLSVGHHYTETALPGTCNDPKRISYTCTDCSHSYIYTSDDISGHDLICEVKDGVIYKECANCDEVSWYTLSGNTLSLDFNGIAGMPENLHIYAARCEGERVVEVQFAAVEDNCATLTFQSAPAPGSVKLFFLDSASMIPLLNTASI